MTSSHARDTTGRISSLCDAARFPLTFNQGVDVCVDKQLLPFKVRCRFRQYMSNKPAKYGIKVWVTCAVASSCTWRMQVYMGKPWNAGDAGPDGGAPRMCDNFFTSFALAEELLIRKIVVVGTIWRNKPEHPPELLQL